VSYRIGDRVYWTRRPVLLAPGEPVLSDGTNEVRARCGNRIDDRVLGETSEAEPDAGVLDTPLVGESVGPAAPGVAPLVGRGIPALLGGMTHAMFPREGAPDSPDGNLGAGLPGGPPGAGGGIGRTPDSPGPTVAGPDVPGGGPSNRSPGGPVDPGKPGGPDSPPGGPGSPDNPGSPGGPDTPGTPGGPDGPGTPGGPGAPEPPGGPVTPGGPGTPGTPGNPGTPSGPEAPGSPGGPGTPETPGYPGGPGNPGPPDNPGHPGTPDTPGTPGHPTTPPPILPDVPPYIPPGEPLDTGETPEPATLALLALGAGAWLASRTSRRKV